MKEKSAKSPSPAITEYSHDLSHLVGCVCKDCLYEYHEFNTKSRVEVFRCDKSKSNAPKNPQELQELVRQHGNRRECPLKRLNL